MRTQRHPAGAPLGRSSSNVGVVGATGDAAATDDALYDLMASGVHGVGGREPGVCGRSEAIGVLGEGGTGGVGTWGIAGDAQMGDLPPFPVGAWGQGVAGEVGVLGQAASASGAHRREVQVSLNPQPLPPTGVWGQAAGPDAFGVVALNGDGRALSVRGRAAFSGVAKGSIAPKSDSAFVAAPNVDANTLVSLALMGDPGNGTPWVEIQPGRGFVVHLTAKAKGPAPLPSRTS